MPWIAKLNPTSAARTSIPKLGTIPRTKLLDVDFGYVFAVAFVLWAFFSCILRPACHHMKHGPILVAISQGGLQTFAAERLLHSAQVSDFQCYVFCRMSGFLDDPTRSAVGAILKRCLRFRNLPIPRSAQPLCIPFLAHSTFSANVRKWIQGHIIRYKDFLVPFHLPSKTVTSGKHCSFRSVLYNNIAIAESWTWDEPPTCHCELWKQQHLSYKQWMDILPALHIY